MSFVSRGQTDTTCGCVTPGQTILTATLFIPVPDNHVGKLGSRRGQRPVLDRARTWRCQRRHGWRYGKQSGQERPDGKQVGAFDCGVFRFIGVRAVAAKAGDSLQHVLNMRESVGYARARRHARQIALKTHTVKNVVRNIERPIHARPAHSRPQKLWHPDGCILLQS